VPGTSTLAYFGSDSDKGKSFEPMTANVNVQKLFLAEMQGLKIWSICNLPAHPT
jgi:hypothetical protein